MTGAIEIDETYVGGVGVKVHGRGAKRKAIAAIAAEVGGRGPGRIRMSIIPDVSATSLHEFILNNVTKGAELRTDEWRGYRHIMTNISDSVNHAHIRTN